MQNVYESRALFTCISVKPLKRVKRDLSVHAIIMTTVSGEIYQIGPMTTEPSQRAKRKRNKLKIKIMLSK